MLTQVLFWVKWMGKSQVIFVGLLSFFVSLYMYVVSVNVNLRKKSKITLKENLKINVKYFFKKKDSKERRYRNTSKINRRKENR